MKHNLHAVGNVNGDLLDNTTQECMLKDEMKEKESKCEQFKECACKDKDFTSILNECKGIAYHVF